MRSNLRGVSYSCAIVRIAARSDVTSEQSPDKQLARGGTLPPDRRQVIIRLSNRVLT